MRQGEMAQDRWGRWQWPIDTIAVGFRQSYPAKYTSLTHCPFCGEMLPNVSDAAKAPWDDPSTPPPPAESAGQGDGDDAN